MIRLKDKLIYTAITIVLVYLLVWIFTPKPEIPVEYKNAIDSLEKQNNILIQKQKIADSVIFSYQSQIKKIDSSIDNIKEKTIIIRETHQKIIERVSRYNSTQIDSFFKTRYNY